MAKAKLEKEIESFLENLPDELNESFLELSEVTDENLQFTIGEEEYAFTVTYPKDYPANKEERFFVFTEETSLSDWQGKLNDFCERPKVTISQLLTEAAEKFLKQSGKQEDSEGELGEEENFPVQEVKKEKPKKTKEEQEVERKLAEGEFLEVGSPQATLRLISDLKALKKQNSASLGFSADPVKDKNSGLENLYHWHIQLNVVDKVSDLYKDMQKFKQVSGLDYILLEMKFSKDYPHVPPFVRVVKPRFAFRTGHVTVGGSICMELLTMSGWNATNDIESILVQIGAELVGGGARLDAGMSNNYEYAESEAWEAFYRAAGNHGWNISGLSQQTYTLLPKN